MLWFCKLIVLGLKTFWKFFSYLLIIQAQVQPVGFWRRRALWDFPVGRLVPIWNRPFFFCYSSWEKDLTRGGSFQHAFPHARICFFCVKYGLELRPESFTKPQRKRNNGYNSNPGRRECQHKPPTRIHIHRLFGLNTSAIDSLLMSFCSPLDVSTLRARK